MKNLVLSPSSLNEIQLCQRRFYFSRVLRRVPFIKAEPLVKGDLMHVLLENYYLHRMEDNNRLPIMDAMEAATEKGRQHAITIDLPVVESENIIKVFHEYVDYYKEERWVPIAVEQPFSKVLYEREDIVSSELDETGNPVILVEGVRLLIEGKIDCVFRLVDGNIVITDHKTGKRFMKATKLSNQGFAYAFGTGIPNFIYNRIGFQKTYEPKDRFVRPNFSYTEEDIDSWADETIYWAEYILKCIETNYYPANFTSCDKFGGCIYKSVCERPPQHRMEALEKNFQQAPEHDIFSSRLFSEEEEDGG